MAGDVEPPLGARDGEGVRRARALVWNVVTAGSVLACVACLFWWSVLCNGGAFDRKDYHNPLALAAEWVGVPMWLATLVAAALPLGRIFAAVRRA